MGEVINLNQYRKEQTKQKKKSKAAENRVKFGTSAQTKKLGAAQKDLEQKRIEEHKLDLLSAPEVKDDEKPTVTKEDDD